MPRWKIKSVMPTRKRIQVRKQTDRGLLSYKGLGFPESDLLTSIRVLRRAQLVY